MHTNYEQLAEELNRLKKQMNLLQTQLNTLPPGKICIARNHKNTRYYQSDGHTSTYIPKRNMQLIQDFITKKYLNLKLEYLSNEHKILQSCLNHHQKNPDYSQETLLHFPEYAEHLSPYIKEILTPSQEWMTAPFDRNPNHQEHLRFTSISGNVLRSKSEYMIDSALFASNIPFRYECKLVLNHSTLYPDFTILHPVKKQLIYWEHFGMIDNAPYSDNVTHKIKNYLSNDIIPNVNLFLTYESKDSPLTYDQIEQIIQKHLLS